MVGIATIHLLSIYNMAGLDTVKFLEMKLKILNVKTENLFAFESSMVRMV